MFKSKIHEQGWYLVSTFNGLVICHISHISKWHMANGWLQGWWRHSTVFGLLVSIILWRSFQDIPPKTRYSFRFLVFAFAHRSFLIVLLNSSLLINNNISPPSLCGSCPIWCTPLLMGQFFEELECPGNAGLKRKDLMGSTRVPRFFISVVFFFSFPFLCAYTRGLDPAEWYDRSLFSLFT